jgi:hypothetical protein
MAAMYPAIDVAGAAARLNTAVSERVKTSVKLKDWDSENKPADRIKLLDPEKVFDRVNRPLLTTTPLFVIGLDPV